MYLITVVNSTGEYTLFNTFDDDLKVINPTLSLELNKSGTLTFQIPSTHQNREQILPLASEIYVYDNNSIYWIGRPLSIENEFDLMATVTCEGILGYLLDTQVPPFDFTGSNSINGTDCVKKFLQRLVNSHNAKLSSNWVDSRKKFTVGTVNIIDSNANLARSSEDYHSTLETINEKLLNSSYGGYIRVRVVSNTRYIDYIDGFEAATQPITFGENLLDLTTHVQTDTLYTVVIPQGAEIESTGKRVNLLNYSPTTSVANKIKEYTHGGAKYNTGSSNSFANAGVIYDAQGVSKHGRVFVELTLDDVTTQGQLALKAAKYIGEVSVLGETLELSAVDLSSIDVDYHRFNLGENVNVVSLPHDIQAEYQITKMNIDLYDPANSSMTLGGELRTFTFENTKQVVEFNNTMFEEITSAVQNATSLLSGGKGGYLIIRQNEDTGQPEEILIMNQATEVSATNCVRINKNGIGFGKKSSGQTAEAWVYRNAWTIDGNLVADFITSGTLNANRIKAGVLSDTAGNTSLNMSTGALSIKKGSINLGSGKFTVNDSGEMKAVSGTVGGLSLSERSIYKKYKIGGVSYEAMFTAPTRSYDSVFMVVRGSKVLFDVTAEGSFLSESGNAWISNDPSGSELGYGEKCRVYCAPDGLWLDTGRSTTAHSGNLYITGTGAAYYANEGSSSRKIKTDIKEVEKEALMPERLYDANVIQYKYKDDFLSEDDDNRGKDLVGFIVEDLDEVYPAAVQKETEDSKTWTWSPYRIIPPMLKLIQDQKKQIDSLEERLEKLEKIIAGGKNNG